MARFTLLYRNGNGEAQALVVNDPSIPVLHEGVEVDGVALCREHGEDFNEGGGVFLVVSPAGNPVIYDEATDRRIVAKSVDFNTVPSLVEEGQADG